MSATVEEKLTGRAQTWGLRGKKLTWKGQGGTRAPILPPGQCGEGCRGLKEVPPERDGKKVVLRTEPDFHSNETMKEALRNKVRAEYFANSETESH